MPQRPRLSRHNCDTVVAQRMRARESGKYQARQRKKQREPEQCLEVARKYLQHIDGDCAGGDCRRAEKSEEDEIAYYQHNPSRIIVNYVTAERSYHQGHHRIAGKAQADCLLVGAECF